MLYKSNKVELHPKFAREFLYLQIIDENITFVEKKMHTLSHAPQYAMVHL
jgi:hypothetical protein